MRFRFGIAGRLVLIGTVGFLALLTLFGILTFQFRNQENIIQRAFPLPEQLAALVSTADTLDADEREVLLRAVNNPNVSIAIAARPPTDTGDARRMPLVEHRLKRIAPLSGREVHVMSESGSALLAGPSGWLSGVPMMVAVQLADGEYLVVSTRGALFSRYFGIPSGFLIAGLSLLIAGVTLIALVRETRPLRDLTAALGRFSESAVSSHVKPAGAADVRKLIETVNRMQDRIATMVKGRTILAGAISHDLKTYLTRLRLRIDDIADPQEREGAERDLAAMLSIVENAMSLAKSGAGTRDRAAIDLAALARAESARFADAGAAITVVADGPIPVMADAIALGRVIGNLLENACRYANRIEISVAQEDGIAMLRVDDNGQGIPVAEREAVFEPFYRLDPARNARTGGSGLGLALCRQIVENHGGEITIADTPLGGTRVLVRLQSAAAPVRR